MVVIIVNIVVIVVLIVVVIVIVVVVIVIVVEIIIIITIRSHLGSSVYTYWGGRHSKAPFHICPRCTFPHTNAGWHTYAWRAMLLAV